MGNEYPLKKKGSGHKPRAPMRKERDLNPRYPLGVCVLSRDVLSATQPSFQNYLSFDENDYRNNTSVFMQALFHILMIFLLGAVHNNLHSSSF